MSFIFFKNAQIELTTDCVHRADVVCTGESLEGPQVESPLSVVSHDNPHLLQLFLQKHHSPELCMRQHKQSDRCLMCYRV